MKNVLHILTVITVLAISAGCHRAAAPPDYTPPEIIMPGDIPAGTVTPVSPTAAWQWDAPAPVVPPMAWVAAGPFRHADRTPTTVDAIVIHTTEGGFRDEQTHEENQNRNFAGVINYFKGNNRNVSAHYVMGPNGEICQMVNETDVAHTQTYYNGRAFGIECAGWSSRPETWTPELLDSLVDLCAYLCVKWEIPAYHPEGTAYEGEWQVTIDEDTKRFVGTGLVGHYQVQPWNKSDPGDHFPWEEFSRRVREKIRESGAEPIPLPDAEAEKAKLVYVSADIVEDDVQAGEPFTYRLVVHGAGAGDLTPEDIVFPVLESVDHVTQNGEVRRVESSPLRAVYELPLIASENENFNLTASRVRLNGAWQDSGTTRVRMGE